MITHRLVVQGFPPEGSDARSIWDQSIQSDCLIRLRCAALKAMRGKLSLARNTALSLKLHIGKVHERSISALDKYVSGICEGLKAANPGEKLDKIWHSPIAAKILPDKAIVFLDESQITCIKIEKIFGATGRPWYELAIEESES